MNEPCPCCGYRTLRERGGFEICPVCFWEDDGQDNDDADGRRGGPKPNRVSLTEGRRNFLIHRVAELKDQAHVRAPRQDEPRVRRFALHGQLLVELRDDDARTALEVVLPSGTVLGRGRMLAFDRGMGVMSGVFEPAESWSVVEAVFRLFTEGEPAAYYRARDALGLTVRTALTQVVLPTHAVHVVDYRRDLEDPEAIEIEVYLSDILAEELKQSILGDSR